MALRQPMPDVIVLIPGILGSVLAKSGKALWTASLSKALWTGISGGRNLDSLVLQESDSEDGIEALGLIQDLHLIPYLWKIDGYSAISHRIQQEFDVTSGLNFFEFPYDWRQDNRIAAEVLQRNSRKWLEKWRKMSGNEGAQLVIVAHSMGGLVARHFLEVLEGWRECKALVTFGTPYRGSLDALEALANGIRKGPKDWIDLSALVRSFPSVYQLLPTYPCVAGRDGKMLRVSEVIASRLDPNRVADAMSFHSDIASAENEHQSDEEYRDGGYLLAPIVGTNQPTSQSAVLNDSGTMSFVRSHGTQDLGGDGTVPRVSAWPSSLDGSASHMFTASRHSTLQNARPSLDQLAGVITNLYVDTSKYRTAPAWGSALGLDIDDAFWADEPIRVLTIVEGNTARSVKLTIESVDSTDVIEQFVARSAGEWLSTEVRPLAPGNYRVTMSATGAVPVADVFAVLDAKGA